jgi:hypothetical protein
MMSKRHSPSLATWIHGLNPIRIPARFRTCTNSHPVAGQAGCTNIPLSTGKGSGKRDHSSGSAVEAIVPVGPFTRIRQG